MDRLIDAIMKLHSDGIRVAFRPDGKSFSVVMCKDGYGITVWISEYEMAHTNSHEKLICNVIARMRTELLRKVADSK